MLRTVLTLLLVACNTPERCLPMANYIDYGDDEEAFVMPGDDFEHAVQSAPSRGARIDGWASLCAGKTVGKRINIGIPAGQTQRTDSLNMFEIGGLDRDAIPVSVTLGEPKFIPADKLPGGVVTANNITDSTGERSNSSLLEDPFPGISNWVPAVAILEWGVGGVQHTAEIDWVIGATVNLSASWVRISAFIDQVQTFGAISSGVVSLRAFVGPGGINRGSSAQRSIVVGAIREADSGLSRPGFPIVGFGPNQATYPIPLFPIPSMAKQAVFAGIISDIGTSVWVADYDVQLLFYQGTTGALVSAVRFTPNIREPAVIPNGTAFFTVQNLGLGVVNFIFASSVIFDLSI